ncbi:Ligand-binding SRPBCC domain-containing protein [Desulfacinum hydrothermale DSM 13146]|uniref:Ligand-binding SRPBCC domain-containing protein n=1 Tax=Desulfacinum hydrothermale DSM 13146 TaxID=1121390 RepID=A0A1W1XP76_9BACT|nr:SRPBCC family protein [Desulfacinum hydrothermale]SMC25655.1 Ligand-binding SRPBCC domain-containing protein [Desulfacinum hydrothermale DSM 13146]
MRIHHFETRILLPASPAHVFPFFADAANLERITPPELSFRILTELPIAMAEGTLIDYKLRLFGVPFRWKTRIRKWAPPRCFVDEQIRGPYRLWVHTHTFEPRPQGTLMTDRVRYALPLYPLGEMGAPAIHRLIQWIFWYRARALVGLIPEVGPPSDGVSAPGGHGGA